MDQLFDATRGELESSNSILNITLDEALSLCKGGRFDSAKERATVFAGLFDRLAVRVSHVIRVIREHGVHFGTVPNVRPLSSSNFRGDMAQRVAFMDSVLAKVVFRQRTRFFHKLYALAEIVEELQKQVHVIVSDISEGVSRFPHQAWEKLEVLDYDLNTCMGEATVVLKSFFCALPAEELPAFREKLLGPAPAFFTAELGKTQSFRN